MSLKDGASRETDAIIGVLHFPPTNDNKQCAVRTCIA